LSLILLAPTHGALALEKITVSFVMINPRTGANAGDSARITLAQVNRNDRQTIRTNSDGIATFTIDPVDYILTSECWVCFADNMHAPGGTQYLIQPQPNGTVVVKSAADEVMRKDGAGRWKITVVDKRAKLRNDPWQLLSNLPANLGMTAHEYLLTDGRVLMQTVSWQTTGWKDLWWTLTPDLLGRYATGTWTKISSPAAGYNPTNFNAAVLHDGRFFVAGGEQNSSATGVFQENINQIYTLDLVTNSWSSVTPPNGGTGDWTGIGASPFVELADGSVMIGHNGDSTHRGPTFSALFNPQTSAWAETGANKQSANQEQGYTLLQNDLVLDISSGDISGTMTELFNPATGLWTQGPDLPYELGHSEIGPALSLPNGKVLATGATGRNALYDPFTNSWSTVPDFPALNNGLQLDAADNPAAVLPNGNVLIATSVFTCSTQNCFWMAPQRWFEYDWATNTWKSVPDSLYAPASSTIANDAQSLVLPTGEILVITAQGPALYHGSGGPNAAWAPTVTVLPVRTIHPGTEYTLSGTQLAGLTQGSFWGDEQQNATNYGLVQIENIATGHKYFARAFDYSSTSIAQGASSTLSFTLGSTVENGPSRLRVIANGIASAPENITVIGYAPQISRKGSITLKSLAAGLGLKVASGATISAVVASASASVCKVSGGTLYSKGVKSGTCSVTVTVQAKKPANGPKPAPVKASVGVVVR
jgi:hypothetical protein